MNKSLFLNDMYLKEFEAEVDLKTTTGNWVRIPGSNLKYQMKFLNVFIPTIQKQNQSKK